jgi:hypothetical protein
MTSKNLHPRELKSNQIIQKKLRKINFKEHEIKSGFVQRKPRKIRGKALLISFLLMAMRGKNTFQQWAEYLSLLTGETISKQGVWKRITEQLSVFLSAILLDLLEQQLFDFSRQLRHHKGSLKNYQRVLLQDSTTLALPACLKWCYPGNVTKGKKKAQLKLQVVYDLINECFVKFEITAFNVNDQSKSKDIITIARDKDLVIRDLGYFVLDSFKEMNRQNINFISRLRYGVSIYDVDKEKPLSLLDQLRKSGRFDGWVKIGKKYQLRVRLVAIKLPDAQANARRRKAKQNRDKRLNHSKEYYELLGYHIFITNEEPSKITSTQIADLYGLRWRIETIFKCWKSYFHLQKLLPQHCSLNKERVDSVIYMFLIFILLTYVTIYNYLKKDVETEEDSQISMAKLSRFIANHIEWFLLDKSRFRLPNPMYYCRYDKRNDRKNHIQKLRLS